MVIDYSVVGGVERVTSSLIDLFLENDIAVSHILSINSANKEPLLQYHSSVKPYVFKEKKGKGFVEELSGFLQEQRIDTLIFQGDNMTIALNVLKAAKLASCQAFLHYHGSPYAYLKKHLYGIDYREKPINLFKSLLYGLKYPIKKAKLYKVLHHAKDGVICVSNGSRKELEALFPGQVGHKLMTIHNPPSFAHGSSECDLSQKKKQLIYVSRLERTHKNSFFTIRVWEQLFENHPDWELIILGDGRLRQKMEHYCKEKSIANVHFKGLVNNVNTYFQQSSIALLVSDTEGFGMVMAEGASYCNAMVATKSDGGISDIVVDGENGYLVERDDLSGMVDKLSLLMEDEALRNSFARAARLHIDHYSSEDIIDKWKQLIIDKHE